MEIVKLTKHQDISGNDRLSKQFHDLERLLAALQLRELPASVIQAVNEAISSVNSFSGSEKELSKQIAKAQNGILRLIGKELKVVPKNYYRNLWMALGMSAFGLPIGLVFGLMIGNIAFLGIGLPIGLVIGLALGTALDKKAFESGKQLDLELNY